MDESTPRHPRAKPSFDPYFTNPTEAESCVAYCIGVIDMVPTLIVEPSYGKGAFVDAIRKVWPEVRIEYMDIAADDPSHRKDFFKYKKRHERERVLTIGNPPFGRNASLAVRFFNHAATFSEAIAFILPRTFRKSALQNRLDRHFSLRAEQNMPPFSFVDSMGAPFDASCVFQVWARGTSLRLLVPQITRTADFEFLPFEERARATVAIRRVGAVAGRFYHTDLHLLNEDNYFIQASAEVLQVLTKLDLEHTPSKYDTVSVPSLSKHDICTLYLRSGIDGLRQGPSAQP